MPTCMFLPLIFSNTEFQLSVIYFAYFSYLTTSLIGYFANYKQTLLGADQRNYVVTAYYQSAVLLKTLIQMTLTYYTGNYYLWISMELILGITYTFILNWRIKKHTHGSIAKSNKENHYSKNILKSSNTPNSYSYIR